MRTAGRGYPPEFVKTMKGIFSWLNQDYDKVAVEQAVMGGGTGNTVVRLPMVYGPGDPLHRMHGVLKRIADGRRAIILADELCRMARAERIRGECGACDCVGIPIGARTGKDVPRL